MLFLNWSTLQMPTFADQLAAGMVPVGKAPEPWGCSASWGTALHGKELSFLSSTPHPQCLKEFQTHRDPRDILQRKKWAADTLG